MVRKSFLSGKFSLRILESTRLDTHRFQLARRESRRQGHSFGPPDVRRHVEEHLVPQNIPCYLSLLKITRRTVTLLIILEEQLLMIRVGVIGTVTVLMNATVQPVPSTG